MLELPWRPPSSLVEAYTGELDKLLPGRILTAWTQCPGGGILAWLDEEGVEVEAPDWTTRLPPGIPLGLQATGDCRGAIVWLATPRGLEARSAGSNGERGHARPGDRGILEARGPRGLVYRVEARILRALMGGSLAWSLELPGAPTGIAPVEDGVLVSLVVDGKPGVLHVEGPRGATWIIEPHEAPRGVLWLLSPELGVYEAPETPPTPVSLPWRPQHGARRRSRGPHVARRVRVSYPGGGRLPRYTGFLAPLEEEGVYVEHRGGAPTLPAPTAEGKVDLEWLLPGAEPPRVPGWPLIVGPGHDLEPPRPPHPPLAFLNPWPPGRGCGPVYHHGVPGAPTREWLVSTLAWGLAWAAWLLAIG